MRRETIIQSTLKIYVPLKDKLQEHLVNTTDLHRLQRALINEADIIT